MKQEAFTSKNIWGGNGDQIMDIHDKGIDYTEL